MRRIVHVLIAGLLLGTAFLSAPAGAFRHEAMTVGLGQKVTQRFPEVLVPMPLLDLSYSPGLCTDTPWCDVVPISVKLAPRPEMHRLTIELAWRADENLSAAGHCALYLWNDPEGLYEIKEANCEGITAQLDFVPIKTKYLLVVRNFTSLQNAGYDLTLKYQ